MHFLKILERRRDIWALIGIIITFFFLRLPSLTEPYWYGDEGIYEVIGKALRNGHILYSQIWDNKPPLFYIVYAIFNGDQFLIRFFSLIVGVITVILFYVLTKKIFHSYSLTIFLTILFTIFFGTPFVEGNIANAENFIMPLALAASYLLLKGIGEGKKNETRTLQIVGLLLGIAFLFKIVAVFDFLALATLLLFQHLPRKNQFWPIRLKTIFQLPLFHFFLFFVLPFLVTCAYFLLSGALSDFLSALLLSNVSYVGYRNDFLFPQGLLFFKIVVLLGFIIILYKKRRAISVETIFILLWFSFSLFNTFFSQRPYTHYLLVILPSFLLFLGLISSNLVKKKLPYALYFLLAFFLITSVFRPKSPLYMAKYYHNFVLFVTNNKSVSSYQTFFDRNTPRDYEVASFLRTHTSKKDNIFVWGNSGQIYALANKLPPGKFIVAYHISGNKKAIANTIDGLNKKNPRFIAILPDTKEIPFDLSNYRYRLAIQDADIYERIY